MDMRNAFLLDAEGFVVIVGDSVSKVAFADIDRHQLVIFNLCVNVVPLLILGKTDRKVRCFTLTDQTVLFV